MFLSNNLWKVSFAAALLVVVLIFQNCGSSRSYSQKPLDPEGAIVDSESDGDEDDDGIPDDQEDDDDDSGPASCKFDGKTVAHGAGVMAYQASTVPYGQKCNYEIRACSNGVLSGTFEYGSCTPGAPASCLIDGITVPHNQSVTAYLEEKVAYNQTCASISLVRKCTNGVLSGSNTYDQVNCSVTPPKSCTFNGKTVAHGASVTAFATSSVPNGQTCTSQSRTCTDGVLSGTYAHPTCTVAGIVPTNVTVSISCSVNAGNTQVLRVTSQDGTYKQWTIGSGNISTSFTTTFTSAPTGFQAYSNGNLSKHRYTNQTAHSIRFESEDQNDNDYNDLICNFSW